MTVTMIKKKKSVCVNERNSDVVQRELVDLFVSVCGKVFQQCLGDIWGWGCIYSWSEMSPRSIDFAQSYHSTEHSSLALRRMGMHAGLMLASCLMHFPCRYLSQRSKSTSSFIIGISTVIFKHRAKGIDAEGLENGLKARHKLFDVH